MTVRPTPTVLLILALVSAMASSAAAAEKVRDLKVNLRGQGIEARGTPAAAPAGKDPSASGRIGSGSTETIQTFFERKYRANLRDTSGILALLDRLVETGAGRDLAALGNVLAEKYRTNRELAPLMPVYRELAVCLEEQAEVERMEKELPPGEAPLLNPIAKVRRASLDALKTRVTERFQKVYHLFLGQYRKAFLAHLKRPGQATLADLREAERRLEKLLPVERRVKKSPLDTKEAVPPEHNRLAEVPKNPKQVPADLVEVVAPDKVRIRNVMWRYAPPAAPVYKTVTVDVSNVKDAFYVSERFAPEWVAAHGMILVTMKDKSGIVTDDGESTNALFLSVEAWIRHDQKPDLVSGIKRNFKLIYMLLSMEAGLGMKCLSQEHKIDMFRLNLTAERKQALLREVLFQAILNRSQEYYHTLHNSCVTNAVKCVNDILEPERRLNFWAISGKLHNMSISVPIFLNGFLIEKKITTLSEVILPENHKKFIAFDYDPVVYPGKKWDSGGNLEMQKKLDEASRTLR